MNLSCSPKLSLSSNTVRAALLGLFTTVAACHHQPENPTKTAIHQPAINTTEKFVAPHFSNKEQEAENPMRDIREAQATGRTGKCHRGIEVTITSINGNIHEVCLNDSGKNINGIETLAYSGVCAKGEVLGVERISLFKNNQNKDSTGITYHLLTDNLDQQTKDAKAKLGKAAITELATNIVCIFPEPTSSKEPEPTKKSKK